MKKKYVLLGTVLLLVIAFTGCKKSNDDSSETNARNQGDSVITISAAPTTAAPTAEPTTAPAATNAPAEAVTASDNTTTLYKDGVYEIETPLDYESYYTTATVTIEEGKITNVDWTIYDSGHDNKPFDSEYYKVMEQYSDLYVQQAKDDWTGSRGYSDSLIESQDVDQVDAVSGATWTNKKFKEVVKMALEKAVSE